MSSKETEGLLAGSVEQAYLANRSAGGKRRTEALGALQAMYVFQFCGSLAYGMWAVISPYFLEARGYSTVGAANMYTFAWVAYNVGQIIMSPIAGDIADGHGRRPVFLASAFVVTIFFLTFVYPASWWWITGSFFQGAADVSWGLANAVVVDCVGQGVVPGGAEDWAPLRLFRAVATGVRHDSLDDNVRQELAVAMESVWILGGAGALVGSALAYPVWTYFNDGAAMAFPGLFYFTLLAFAYSYFPETRPDAAAAQRLDNPTAIAAAIRDGIAAQAKAVPLVLRDRRAAWLVGSYFTLYVVMTGLLNIGIYWGQATFGWGIESGTVFTCLSIAAPFIGAVAASAALFPSSLRYARSVALLLALSIVGSLAVGFLDDSAAALTLVPLATVGWGVFPTLTALLTPEASGDQQGHLQGALWATTNVGGLVGLGLYLLVYNATAGAAPPTGSAVWLLSAGGMAIAALCALAAGEPEQEAFSLVKFVRSGRVSVPDANI